DRLEYSQRTRWIYRCGFGLLGELFAALINGHRQMDVAGYRQRQQSRQLYLACARFQQVRPAHDVGHTVLAVVHRGGQMERIYAIGAIHNEISAVALKVQVPGSEEV